MKKVFYLCFYDVPENKEQDRNYVLAAATKLSYEAGAMAGLGYDVEIVSAASTKTNRFCKGSVKTISDNVKLRLFDSPPSGDVIKRYISRTNMRKRIKKYLSENVGSDDILMVYHSLYYMDIVSYIKKNNNPRLILEANEIYSDVLGTPEKRDREIEYFSQADAFVLSTELLNEKINKEGKPYVINYGTFEIAKDFSKEKIFNDDRIHIVYAGVLEPKKGSVLAIESARYLDEHYHIHIIGFGTEKDTQLVNDTIDKISAETTCGISFDGKFSGDDYLRFLQSCQIGLSPQSADADFNETSFPSKILSYLSNGLRVVSIRIKSIEQSKVSDLVYFFNESKPEDLADAIKSVDLSDKIDIRRAVMSLDEEFRTGLKTILE